MARDFQRFFDGYVADGSILHWKPEPGLEDKACLGIHKDQATIVVSCRRVVDTADDQAASAGHHCRSADNRRVIGRCDVRR
ncbi:hypothetical protein E1193_17225 [Micromonospora sp. KC606]|uniref:hypothetical protein n=1 Tax=Micromonospora sp. KC606 TaxID=2530379 RepID=UPI0010507E74|nr:hypothetical protein [Micromonospora sp. KC606]TDC80583.1 hypothetical protein E1193_17225 [Micromonospora sp. KC606]